jgi:hypothetical protein
MQRGNKQYIHNFSCKPLLKEVICNIKAKNRETFKIDFSEISCEDVNRMELVQDPASWWTSMVMNLEFP